MGAALTPGPATAGCGTEGAGAPGCFAEGFFDGTAATGAVFVLAGGFGCTAARLSLMRAKAKTPARATMWSTSTTMNAPDNRLAPSSSSYAAESASGLAVALNFLVRVKKRRSFCSGLFMAVNG